MLNYNYSFTNIFKKITHILINILNAKALINVLETPYVAYKFKKN